MRETRLHHVPPESMDQDEAPNENPHGFTPEQMRIAKLYSSLNRKQKREVKAIATKRYRKEQREAKYGKPKAGKKK